MKIDRNSKKKHFPILIGNPNKDSQCREKPYIKAGATNSEDNAANQANGEEEEPAICVVCETVGNSNTEDPTEDAGPLSPLEIRHSSVKASTGHSFTGNVLDYRKQPTL